VPFYGSDGCGLHLNEESILDYKQTNKPKKEEYIEDYYLQLTAYALAHNEIHGTKIRKGVVLMCVKPPEITPLTWGEPKYTRIYPYARSLWILGNPVVE